MKAASQEAFRTASKQY